MDSVKECPQLVVGRSFHTEEQKGERRSQSLMNPGTRFKN